MVRRTTEERQAQIKKAILDIIASEGLHALSTRNVARRVGVSEGALFRHFPSKLAMIEAIIADVKKDLLTALKAVTLRNLPPADKLFQFLCTHVTYLLQNRGITIFLFSEAAYLNDQHLKKQLRDILLQQKQLVSKIIQDGIVEGIWDPELSAENVALLYMGIPITLSIEMVLDPEGVNTENFCRKMFSLLIKVLKRD